VHGGLLRPAQEGSALAGRVVAAHP
jgi:hypothetical protein